MKTFRTKLKSSLIGTSVLLSLILLSFPLLAKPVAQVIVVKGQVFVVTPEGKTKSLKVNDHVEEKSEVFVGEDGDVTLNDYYDATYHLIEGSHLKFFNKSVQLKKGKTWIKALGSRSPLTLTTANASVDFSKGEFITTFEQGSAKTQVLVVNGELEVSNVLDKNMKSVVMAGSFTIVDPEVENGVPRSPTRVGLASLNKSLMDFKTLPETLKETKPAASREIASVPEPTVKGQVKGQIVFMSNGKLTNAARVPASVAGSAHAYFKKKAVVKKSFTNQAAPIRFYGMQIATPKEQVAISPRVPASINSQLASALPNKVGPELNEDKDFADSFRNSQKSQPKHSKELENLIEELSSY